MNIIIQCFIVGYMYIAAFLLPPWNILQTPFAGSPYRQWTVF